MDLIAEPHTEYPAPHEPQPHPEPATSHAHKQLDFEDTPGGEVKESTIQSKICVWKCEQCRDSGTECLPIGRTWPQKCDQCLKASPQELQCSKPLLNIRQRRVKLSKSEAAPDSKTQTTTETPEDQDTESENNDKMSIIESDGSPESYASRDTSSSDEEFEQTPRSRAPIKMGGSQKELRRLPMPAPLQPFDREDHHPASAYLPLAQGEFRILSLAPGGQKDEVVVSFITASLGNLPSYEAISYLWGGGQQSSVKITVLDAHRRSHSVYVRGNLLAMKRFIFRNAQNVCFWLSDKDPNFKAAFNFIPHILDIAGIDKLLQNKESVTGWVAFVALLRNPIFNRLWLIQELALAQNATLHAGHLSTHYLDFVDAMSIFLSCRLEISKLLRKHNVDPKDLFDHKTAATEQFVMLTTKALRITASGKIHRQFTLESLVLQTKELDASHPVDRIYSLLPLARDFGEFYDEQMLPCQYNFCNMPLRIDYDRNLSDVCRDFVAHVIDSSRSLDIICRHWIRRIVADLPTYIRTLSSSQLRFDADTSHNGGIGCLLGAPGNSYYSASKGTIAWYKINPNPTQRQASIIFRGFRADKILRLGPRAVVGLIQREWLTLGGCNSETDSIDEIPEVFWRTLVADRGPNGSVTPSWYYRAFAHCLSHSNPNGDINIARLIAESEAGSSLITDFLNRVQSVVCDRKFFISKDHQWFGLAPDGTEIGDTISILYGCSVPVILREGSGDDLGYWRLVGECYVHGIMDEYWGFL
ncbi:hypothetical protein NA56DRAFT_312472 [Hyaloscypha hepaticicola]|uniref:Heterokaryon incompatibility domain-containing protein n=1 Tax=Hyaloscypha hepaticicola TaxID=2082293 RepID=A0A2J6PR88_9HELO|nr:hypothetical protein NA56DRAFT_312472 [Hyaloscypha hepaticicola]